MLRIESLHLQNFRCFDKLDVAFEPDLTVLFAENGGGKTALMTAIAMCLFLLQPSRSGELANELNLEGLRDARRVRAPGDRWEPVGHCQIECTAAIGAHPHVTWRVMVSPTSRRRLIRLADASKAIEQVRAPGARWPLIGYYGTNRLCADQRSSRRNSRRHHERWEGYADCLDPSLTDGPLLDWLRSEALGDLARHRRGEPERHLAVGVLNAIKRATPGVSEIWFDPAVDEPVVRFESGHQAGWGELSDGFHVFMSLVGDIARRAVILNSQDGADAPLLIEGIVLVDEIDLHLHPQWQRIVLAGLRAAFPKLQFIVTTHSPQVLSSVENRQVRRLVDWTLSESGVLVEGRDTNSILRGAMNTDDRDPRGQQALESLDRAIREGRFEDARAQIAGLRERWGTLDPELMRAEAYLREEEED